MVDILKQDTSLSLSLFCTTTQHIEHTISGGKSGEVDLCAELRVTSSAERLAITEMNKNVQYTTKIKH
jgi:hypothetical protein